MHKYVDVAVIGAGVIGMAVTYYLAKNHVEVITLEKGDIAEGTSGKCDGNVLINDKMPGYDCALAKKSQELFPVLAEELNFDFHWTQKGSLYLIENEEEMAAATKYCESLALEGMPVRMLNQREVRRDEPGVAPDIIGGLETQCDGAVDPMSLAYGLAAGAAGLGANIRCHTKVLDIQAQSDGFRIMTDQADVYAKRIVNAAGVWAPQIGRMLGVDIPIFPRKGHILVSDRTMPVARRKVVEFGYMMAKFGAGDYRRNVTPDIEKYGIAMVFEPTHAGNFLIGSSRQYTGMDTRCEIGVLRAMARRAYRFFPAIRDINIIRSYAGVRPCTPDHFPILSETEVPGFFVAAGHEGDGIGLCLITGKLISQWLRPDHADSQRWQAGQREQIHTAGYS